MGRKGWGRREKSAIQQAFIECQVRAEHMVSSNRCCEGDKKETEYALLPSRWRKQKHKHCQFSPRSRHFNLIFQRCLNEEQRPATWGMWEPFSCRSVCVCVCAWVHRHDWGRERKKEEGGKGCIGKWWDWGCRKSLALYGRSFPVFSQSTSDPRWLLLVFWDPSNKLPCSLFTAMHVFPPSPSSLGSRLSVFLDLFWSYLKISLPCSSCAFTSTINLYGSKLLETRLLEEHLCDPAGLSPGLQPQVESFSCPQETPPLWSSYWEWRHGIHYKALLSPSKSVQHSEESGGARTGILLALWTTL